jgi:hypothetical protein
LCSGVKLAQAFFEAAPVLPVFVHEYHPSDVGFGQALELLSQARLSRYYPC